MPEQLDLKFLFYFFGEAISVLEVKINDLPEGTPLGKVYHWLCYDQATQQFQKLDFKSMGTKDNRDYREFYQGELWFDTSKADLKLQSPTTQQTFNLEVHDPSTIPQDLMTKTQTFLHKLDD